ncbi:histidine phosphatase family protein [Arenimonas sp. MALMAid1274]|uniref:histidine phosphatase family protein n=1 Tax=Arenimonas sp. MALMAid1274 TaxID=3411630 RepID=UPI003BA29559
MSRLVLALGLAMLLPAEAAPGAGATVVVVVRHAEKATDDPRDPTLSEAGQARAAALATRLANTGLDAAFATQYRRTQLTAAPAAAQAGIEVGVRPVDAANAERYGPDLDRDLRALPAGSTVLVVGHSNTVPAIVSALSGQATPEMPETEYDRYTVVVLDADGAGRVFQSRY